MRRKLCLLLIIVLLGTGNCAFTWKLPKAELPEASIVLDINGEVINGLTRENQINLEREQIPQDFVNAIIAVEDKNFYRHLGVDPVGIARALITNIKYRKILAGGSTITQQTAKNLYLSNEKTFIRKIKELVYAIQLERKYSKDKILTMYCNTIYFGEGAYGVEVAARTFFARRAEQLSLAQCALLAGLPNSPGNYDPYLHPDAAKKRQAIVLQRMLEEGKIDLKQKEVALQEKLIYDRNSSVAGEAPYFTALVKDYLIDKYGQRMVYQGGLRIYTTLDLDMQKSANQAVVTGLKGQDEEMQVALVALDVRNGHLRAMVGGRNFSRSSYNRVFSLRQPGSTFKPFMYSLAIDQGFTPADTIMCEEVSYKLSNGKIYRPTDYGSKPYHWRPFTLKEAVMLSDNVVAVQVNDILGPKNTAKYIERFGFPDLSPVLSLPLGPIAVKPIEMAAAYATFANRGVYSKPIYILKITDKRGQVLEENHISQKPVIEKENAYIICDMLKGVLEPGGTGSHLKKIIGRSAAGKTGTTDEYQDAWFTGFTPRLCCSVWVGYDMNRNVNLTGGAIAGPIWANFMREASVGAPDEDFDRPAGVDIVNICLDSGLVATEACPRAIEMAFYQGTEPEDICYYHLSGLEFLLKNEDNSTERPQLSY
ncbi:MAG: PBP1A family penicillin-binding protein [Syntrophomonadaceae bacterium]|nr:PBP1A family penicillin-binding protein [Syntrophomonadaceae bacterium]MDD3897886.1 PBP1A family penicillin-binding protein [Syntrophomonadaceae bacterium]